MSSSDIARSWRLLLLEEEATRNYWRTYLLYGLQSHRDALLDEFLPSLIYIKAVTLLDDALDVAIGACGLVRPKRYTDSLAGRIDFLADEGRLRERDELHRIRIRRNEIAHEIGARASWDELAADRGVLHGTLERLGLVRPAPALEYFGERSAMRDTQRPGYSFERDFTYGVKENGAVALEIKWTQFGG